MKKTLSERIMEARKRKGLTQEQLADNAGVNIRTIQRIEAGETEPRGYTLSEIYKVLDLDIEKAYNETSKNQESIRSENKRVELLLQVSVIVGIFFPLGDIVAPMIIWGMNRDKVEGVDLQGKNLITSRIIIDVILILYMLLALTIGFGGLGRIELVLFFYGVSTLIYPIIVVLLIISDKKKNNFYPRFFK